MCPKPNAKFTDPRVDPVPVPAAVDMLPPVMPVPAARLSLPRVMEVLVPTVRLTAPLAPDLAAETPINTKMLSPERVQSSVPWRR